MDGKSESDEQPGEAPAPAGGFDPADHWGWSMWEWWSLVAMGLTGVAACVWLVIWMNVGVVSVVAHAFVIPVLGAFSLPVMLWGLVRTTFRPPLLRRSRLVGFALLLGLGITGNVHLTTAPAAPASWESSVAYRLPFEGTWYTYAGGESMRRNRHATTSAWRWGYDFAPRTDDGRRHRGEGNRLEDYLCYGRRVVAPAAGEVVKVQSGLEDAAPGEFDETSVLGNHVVLKTAESEFVFLSHLKKGSITVETGDEVERGAPLAECGNSGRAVLPHLQIHLQDRLAFPVARGLPLRFSTVQIDGATVESGMPLGRAEGGGLAGQRVEQVSSD